MEDNSEIQEDLGNGGKFKNWLQDNIRIILSVLIVATIAAGIYSYSKRTVVPVDQIAENAEVNLAESDKDSNNAVVVVGDEKEENKTENTEENNSEKLSVTEEGQEADKNQPTSQENVTEKKEDAQDQKEEEKERKEEVKVTEETQEENQVVNSGEETETSFVEVAGRGDSLTTLARRATRQYLEKNPVDGLSKEHKIYIEDYLRKHVNHSTVVRSGEQISFSKDLIKTAIEASKNLNEQQLRNLQKYSARVNNL
jgi:lipopolysaccharide export LptBFGC system permease protein LptF